jgi:hypothetical protein
MIQKRIVIFVWDHAFISKWWWIGAIRRERWLGLRSVRAFVCRCVRRHEFVVGDCESGRL